MHLLMYVQKEEWRNKEEQLVKARNDEIKKNLMIQQQLEAEKGKSQGISAQLEAAQAQLVALKAQKTAEMAELKASHTGDACSCLSFVLVSTHMECTPTTYPLH